jgi:predicted HicB family RNase H-like nuclease
MPRDDKLSMRLPAELKAALQRRADAQERKLANYITVVLQQHVDSTPEPKSTKPRK